MSTVTAALPETNIESSEKGPLNSKSSAKVDEEDPKLSSTNEQVDDTYSFPNGHLGHLSQEQQTALEEFKQLLTTEGTFTPSVGDKPPSHRDSLLLRFLRARRFVPGDAVQQFKDTEHWRKVNDLENLYINIDVNDYDESRKYYTHWTGRRDKRGLPIYLFRIGALDSKAMSKYTKSTAELRLYTPEGPKAENAKTTETKEKIHPRLLRLFAIYENLTGWMTQLCTALIDRPDPEVPITQSNNIVDISGVGLMQFWSLRAHMQDATALATAHYPETLDRIFIVGAPSFFPTIWSFIKRLFDPITVSKIFILSDAQAFSTLSQFIEPENIPKQYGGSLDFQFGDIPTIDPAFADRLTWKDDGGSVIKNSQGQLRRWPRGPVQWTVREDGDWELLAVGSEEGKPRKNVVATMKMGNGVGGWADSRHPVP